MAPLWEVHSHHLSIGEGDSALHFLVDRNDPKLWPLPLIKKAVLVDSGRSKQCINILMVLDRFAKGTMYRQHATVSKDANDILFRKLDVLVLSHLDGDHREGIESLVDEAVYEALRNYCDDHPGLDQAQLQQACDNGLVQPLWFEWGTAANPDTIVYLPYISTGVGSDCLKDSSSKPPSNWIFKPDNTGPDTGTVWVAQSVKLINEPQPWIVSVPLAKYKRGRPIIGMDFFSDTEVPVVSPTGAKYVVDIVDELRLRSVDSTKPAMVCVASNGFMCDEAGVNDRRYKMKWSEDFNDMYLHPYDPEASVQMVRDGEDKTTPNNQASIACFVIWPGNPDYSNCFSHYIAGDLGDKYEDKIVRWATNRPVGNDQRRYPIRVRSHKLSHHGGKYSTPTTLLYAWRPTSVINSNGLHKGHKHPAWENLMLLMTWTAWMHKKDYANDGAIAYFTSYPIYLVRWGENNLMAVKTESFNREYSVKEFWDWRRVITNSWAQASNNPLNFFGDLPTWKLSRHICDYVAKCWDQVSIESGDSYRIGPDTARVWDPNINPNKIFGIIQRYDGNGYLNVNHLVFRGYDWETIDFTQFRTYLNNSFTFSTSSPDIKFKVKGPNWRTLPTPDTPTNKATWRKLGSDNFPYWPIGNSMSTTVASILKYNVDDDKEDAVANIDNRETFRLIEDTQPEYFNSSETELSGQSHTTRLKTSASDVTYFITSDGEHAPDLNIFRTTTLADTDYFLGKLSTAGLIFAGDIATATESILLHDSDDLLQWLQMVSGRFGDLRSKLSAKFSYDSTTKLATVSQYTYETVLGAFYPPNSEFPSGIDPKSVLSFSTNNNKASFYGDELPSINPGQMLIMSLDPKSPIYTTSFTFRQIASLFEFDISATAGLIADISGLTFNVDNQPKSKNALWIIPDNQYSTTLRLQFVVPKEKVDSIQSKMNEIIQDIMKIDLQIQFKNPRIVAKKKWERFANFGDTGRVKTSSELTFVTTLSFKDKVGNGNFPDIQTALCFGEDSTDFILTFEPDTSGHPPDILSMIALLLPGKPTIKLEDYIPSLQNIYLRRVTYSQSNATFKDGKVHTVSLTLQVSLGTNTTLQCKLDADITQNETKLGFHCELFPDNRPDGFGQIYAFKPYMPTVETWTTLPPVDSEKKSIKGSDTGNVFEVFSTASPGDELSYSPFNPQIVGLALDVRGGTINFTGTVVNIPPDDPTGKNPPKTPPIRFEAAALQIVSTYKPLALVKAAAQASLILQCPDPTIQPAKLILEINYDAKINKVWTLGGKVENVSGALLYSLFDSDCNSEIVDVLRNVELDFAMTVTFGKDPAPSTINLKGDLYIGPIKFGYKYQHNGIGTKDKPKWTFKATLAVKMEKSPLQGILAALCGDDVTNALPDWLTKINLDSSTDSQNLTTFNIEKIGDFLVAQLSFALSGSLSLFYYHIQKTRTDLSATDTSSAKRVLGIKLSGLPKVGDIPMIGEIKQPFQEFDFMWVGVSKAKEAHSPDDDPTVAIGLTREELEVLGKLDGGKIRYKDNFKPPEQGKQKNKNDVLVNAGFHFVACNETDVILDYTFNKPSKQDPKSSTELISPKTQQITTQGAATSPMNKTIGPVTITGIGFGFDWDQRIISLIIDGSVKLGPLEFGLIGFAVKFKLQSGKTLKDLPEGLDLDFDIDGLSAAFEKDPIILAGAFERLKKNEYQGAAIIGFTPWLFQAAGYYGKLSPTEETFWIFCRLQGPIATIGYAEIRGLTGGFGYNSTVRFPDAASVATFPFVAPPSDDLPLTKVLEQLLGTDWFKPKSGSYWVAAGLTVLAFQMLSVNAVVAVEWSDNLKLGIFGIATAELPKGKSVKRKFVKVQLGLTATMDFSTMILKIDGQLTPASFILDPSCHLTGGFAFYSWLGKTPGQEELEGQWVFTVGGYHHSYQPPAQFPRPPRLGISWSFNENINITGEAYFAITPRVCMGGGKLSVTLTLGPLSAYLNAWADFLVNYKPFSFEAEAGISVGVSYVLDLWFVSIPIKIDISARLYLWGPPIAGKVHVDFWVFGFDVKFGNSDGNDYTPLTLQQFYDLVLQADNPPPSPSSMLIGNATTATGHNRDPEVEADKEPIPHIFTCTSGLVPAMKADTDEDKDNKKWVVRGAIFEFTVSCKFAISQYTIVPDYKALEDSGDFDTEMQPISVPTGDVHAFPMKMGTKLARSELTLEIVNKGGKTIVFHEERYLATSEWHHTVVKTASPLALWGEYDSAYDPSGGRNPPDLLNGSKKATIEMATGVTLRPPTTTPNDDSIPAFDLKEAMLQEAAKCSFPCQKGMNDEWQPLDPQPSKPYEAVPKAWKSASISLSDATTAWAEAMGWDPKILSPNIPGTLIDKMEDLLMDAPLLNNVTKEKVFS
ncbi:hypothetical protein TWF730_009261 [Orbilia blumenaviensis]|uniref:DUF6603 domain-containing protein n=1 Tax=Orbilia blumenaviensis TaxID=1796055 RepID=A0AAV9V046_9PEZI